MLFLTLHSFWGSVLFFLEYFSELSSEAAGEGKVQEDWNQSEFGLPVHPLNKALAQGLALSGFTKSESRTISHFPQWPPRHLCSAFPCTASSPAFLPRNHGITRSYSSRSCFLYWHQSVLEINTISGLHIDLVKGSWRIHVPNELEVADSQFCHHLCGSSSSVGDPWGFGVLSTAILWHCTHFTIMVKRNILAQYQIEKCSEQSLCKSLQIWVLLEEPGLCTLGFSLLQ